jgi:hypothetical protein
MHLYGHYAGIGEQLPRLIVRYSKRYREDCYGIMSNRKGIYGSLFGVLA